VCIYLDDIFAFSKMEEEHYAHLSQVLAALPQHKLKAKVLKCGYFKPELKFLGHTVSASGMKPDPSKVSAVTAWPLPQTAFEVRAFFGLANYFRKYIQGFAAMVAPLTDLLKGLNKHDKEGKLLLRGRLALAVEHVLKVDFASNGLSKLLLCSSKLKLP
jgi:hypothetical protein